MTPMPLATGRSEPSAGLFRTVTVFLPELRVTNVEEPPPSRLMPLAAPNPLSSADSSANVIPALFDELPSTTTRYKWVPALLTPAAVRGAEPTFDRSSGGAPPRRIGKPPTAKRNRSWSARWKPTCTLSPRWNAALSWSAPWSRPTRTLVPCGIEPEPMVLWIEVTTPSRIVTSAVSVLHAAVRRVSVPQAARFRDTDPQAWVKTPMPPTGIAYWFRPRSARVVAPSLTCPDSGIRSRRP